MEETEGLFFYKMWMIDKLDIFDHNDVRCETKDNFTDEGEEEESQSDAIQDSDKEVSKVSNIIIGVGNLFDVDYEAGPNAPRPQVFGYV
ncbi:unnamed protein product, partial [Ilex paraguariensis]